jgi:hypothetical protein
MKMVSQWNLRLPLGEGGIVPFVSPVNATVRIPSQYPTQARATAPLFRE